MNYKEAVAKYQSDETRDNLYKVAAELASGMTLKEKIRMLSGRGMASSIKGIIQHARFYNVTYIPAGGCKRLGVPEVRFTDGPRGIVMGNSTCFPSSMMRGASFDKDLEYRIGTAIAKEGTAQDANYFAGICINLLRNPKWGRAQETYGEDQCLLGEMGAALTRAVQDMGMVACPKHYALNSIENLRFKLSANVDARTLREVYLPHFKKCFDAGAMSVMGAYNRVNGTYSCESKMLLKDILRDEWGFTGFTSSDFMWGVYNAEKSIKAGMDIEMPYTNHYRKLNKLVKKGAIPESDITASTEAILRGLIKCLPALKPSDKAVIACAEHAALAKEAALKGAVLLKNEANLLPLRAGAVKIAVIGPYADTANTGDHGSSNVHSPYVITPYQGLKAVFGEENVRLYNGLDHFKATSAAKGADCVLICVGCDHKGEGEFILNNSLITRGGDRPTMSLPEKHIKLIEVVSAVNRNIAVNVIGGSAFLLREWEDRVKAIIFSFYSGMEGGNALAELMAGKANFSGRLPFTIGVRESDYPPFLYKKDNKLDIEYGYYHGYALFDKLGKKAAYPFGYGLSYTKFHISVLTAAIIENTVKATVTIKNIGRMAGASVIQLYAGSKGAEQDRPVKQLKGFQRVELMPLETKKVEIIIPIDDLRFYDENTKQWALDPAYTLYAGENAADAMALSADIVMNAGN